MLKAHRRGELSACAVLRAHPRLKKGSDESILAARVSLQEAQHALALHYGLDSWRDLKESVQQRLTEKADLDAVDKVMGQLHKEGNKGAQRIADLASKDDATLKAVFQAASSADKRVKNAAAKVLQLMSAESPVRLYPRFDFFAGLLEGKDNILKWIATDVVGNLAAVDTEDKVDDRLLARFVRLLADQVMITSAHSVENLGKIALHKPQLRQPITAALLKADSVRRHPECHNILAGKRIGAMARYVHLVADNAPICGLRKRPDKQLAKCHEEKSRKLSEEVRRRTIKGTLARC